MIVDKSGNRLAKPEVSAELFPFEYLPPLEEAAIDSGGQGLKIMLVLAFVGQILLKFLVQGSMQYLWDLVHQLQLLSFMLLMDFPYPKNIFHTLEYFEVAAGNLDEVSFYIPEIPDIIIDPDELATEHHLLPESFIENDIF